MAHKAYSHGRQLTRARTTICDLASSDWLLISELGRNCTVNTKQLSTVGIQSLSDGYHSKLLKGPLYCLNSRLEKWSSSKPLEMTIKLNEFMVWEIIIIQSLWNVVTLQMPPWICMHYLECIQIYSQKIHGIVVIKSFPWRWDHCCCWFSVNKSDAFQAFRFMRKHCSMCESIIQCDECFVMEIIVILDP